MNSMRVVEKALSIVIISTQIFCMKLKFSLQDCSIFPIFNQPGFKSISGYMLLIETALGLRELHYMGIYKNE